MLTSVPVAIQQAARQVTLRHPNSFSAVVSRKTVKRVEAGPGGGPSEMGGAPTLGGMGVLRSEDESEIVYLELGPAKVQFAGPGPYQPQDAIDRGNGLLVEGAREVLIECVANPGSAGHFVAENGDLVALEMGLGVTLAYEVATTSGSVNVAPYTRRYVLNPRDDVSYIPGFGN